VVCRLLEKALHKSPVEALHTVPGTVYHTGLEAEEPHMKMVVVEFALQA